MKLYQATWKCISERVEEKGQPGVGVCPGPGDRQEPAAAQSGQAAARALAAKEGILTPRPAEAVLAARGFNAAEAERFLTDRISHDPNLLPDMKEAVERLLQALRSSEMILVYGDYDADGVTATAILYDFLKARGGKVGWYISDRLKEGYGLNERAVAYAKTAGVRLLITVDCGVWNHTEIKMLMEAGIDVIVTDHHTCPDSLPDCRAVVNPRRADNRYPFSGLAGAGVAYKLVEALVGQLNLSVSLLKPYKALATVGTIADMMPLLDENRSLVTEGLLALGQGEGGPGIQTLLRRSSNSSGGERQGRVTDSCKAVEAEDIAFKIAPLINAGSRMGDSLCAPFCLLADGPDQAEATAGRLTDLNHQRRDLEQLVMAACMNLVKMDPSYLSDPILLLNPSISHPGISGIVAARLAQSFLRPTIVLAGDEQTGMATGSGRTFGDFDLYQAVHDCADLLTAHGGHRQAVGLTVDLGRLGDLRKRLNESLVRQGAEGEAESRAFPALPAKYWDLSCRPEQLTKAFAFDLDRLLPFGREQERPRLLLENVRLLTVRQLGKGGAHLRLSVEGSADDSAAAEWPDGQKSEAALPLKVVAFGFGSDYRWLKSGCRLDLLGSLSINRWRGQEELQFLLEDWRFAEAEGETDPISFAAQPSGPPEKEALAAVYRFVTQALPDQVGLLSPGYCCSLLNRELKVPLTIVEFCHIMDIYQEAGLMNLSYSKGKECNTILGITIKQPSGRVDLYQTPTYRRLSGEDRLQP